MALEETRPLFRVACWHGEQAAIYYQKWSRTNDAEDLRNYARHAFISKRMWQVLKQGV
jgi:hypothetical protein